MGDGASAAPMAERVASELAYIKSLETSLDCYKRALGWAGVARGGDGRTGEEILEVEWRALLGELQPRPSWLCMSRETLENQNSSYLTLYWSLVRFVCMILIDGP
jgi:hypothetical protein